MSVRGPISPRSRHGLVIGGKIVPPPLSPTRAGSGGFRHVATSGDTWSFYIFRPRGTASRSGAGLQTCPSSIGHDSTGDRTRRGQ